ncbi:HAD family hydrolase [Terriglobus sp.]|uniref:HAD family hydrolase n=1 Tax=Terriglobus sp. TaxID=1889013 RepID=UPI003B00A38C
MYKAVLCDLDGTLLDSNHFHAEAWQRTFENFDFQVTFEDMVKQIGKGGDQVIATVVPEDRVKDLEEDLKNFRKDLFHREYMDRIVPFSDAKNLLKRMRQEGLRISVASSTNKEDLHAFLMLLRIHALVEEHTTADDAARTKPEPDIFQAALKKLGIESEDAVALGDTPWDVEAANKAGVKTIALTCGGWTEQQLKDAGAIAVYRDPADLLRHFDDSPLAG